MDEVVIWPAFLNSDLSRREGRRLPRKHCVQSPTPDEMLEAATVIGVRARVEGKAYPRRWRSEKKALILEERVSRSKVLRRMAEEIRRTRSA